MACFLVSAAEAVVVTAIEKVEKKKESKDPKDVSSEEVVKIPLSRKLKWLTYMLWGGAVLLMFEHIWHGEVVPWFPFLTAMSDPGDAAEMFHAMATVGVAMAALITAVWIVMCLAADAIVRRTSSSVKEAES
jgi:fatty acid desaturase